MASEIRDRHQHVRDISKREQHRIVEPELDGLEFLAREPLITRVSLLRGFIDDCVDVLRTDRCAQKLKDDECKKSPVFLAPFGGQHLP